MLSLTIRVYLLYRRPLINLYNDYFTNLLPQWTAPLIIQRHHRGPVYDCADATIRPGLRCLNTPKFEHRQAEFADPARS